ncbi:unnamed protein product [Auanema sp. JU1783]|nr:unnamed protein product [Auanema sp. JU1783]
MEVLTFDGTYISNETFAPNAFVLNNARVTYPVTGPFESCPQYYRDGDQKYEACIANITDGLDPCYLLKVCF